MKIDWQKIGREWLDTLVVSISVAMAFRAYFFEPFNIPTGSMQTTLWGYHTEVGKEKGVWDNWPLSIAKWLWTGEKIVEYKAQASGVARIRPRNDGFCDVAVGTSAQTFKLPTDAVRSIAGQYFREGQTVWKGAIITGDFIFVNRWWWNFFRPEVNDVMIFATTGIDKLPQGTHYIKRMKATPGMTYVLEHPVPDHPELPKVITTGENEYFACGDNYENSFDSRYWGMVPAENLRGIGSFVFWPFSGWRKIK